MEKINPPGVEICFSPLSYPLFKNGESIVVVIDILRATSAICYAFYNGVEFIIPVGSVEEATAYKSKGYMTAAERHGEIVDGFELGNSPLDYIPERVKGETIVLTTTNGTQAIEISKNAFKVVIGSFLNLDVLSNWLIGQNRNVILLCAGWKNKFNMEDTLFAGAVAEILIKRGNFIADCDSTQAALRLYDLARYDLYDFLKDSSHRKRLARLDLENDIKFCLTLNTAPVIPVISGKNIVKLEE